MWCYCGDMATVTKRIAESESVNLLVLTWMIVKMVEIYYWPPPWSPVLPAMTLSKYIESE